MKGLDPDEITIMKTMETSTGCDGKKGSDHDPKIPGQAWPDWGQKLILILGIWHIENNRFSMCIKKVGGTF